VVKEKLFKHKGHEVQHKVTQREKLTMFEFLMDISLFNYILTFGFYLSFIPSNPATPD